MFPSAWAFTFWLFWPYFVVKQTQKIMLTLTGQTMTEETADKLRKALAEVTKYTRSK